MGIAGYQCTPSLSRSPEESLAIGTAVLAQPAIDTAAQVSTSGKASDGDKQQYFHLVNTISEGVGFGDWADWTSRATAEWPANFTSRMRSIQNELQKTNWPDNLRDFEVAAKALVYIVAEAYGFFTKKPPACFALAGPDGIDKYCEWQNAIPKLIDEATAAANWFAHVVRRDLDSEFFRDQGRFTVRDRTAPKGMDSWAYFEKNPPKNLKAVQRRVTKIVAPYRKLVKERQTRAK